MERCSPGRATRRGYARLRRPVRPQEALSIIADLKPKRAYLTHLNHDILHARDSRLLPDNVEFAWDGLVVNQ